MQVPASAVPFASRQFCKLGVLVSEVMLEPSQSPDATMARGALSLFLMGVALHTVQAGTRKPTGPPGNTPGASPGEDPWQQTYRRGHRQQPTLHLSAQPSGGAATTGPTVADGASTQQQQPIASAITEPTEPATNSEAAQQPDPTQPHAEGNSATAARPTTTATAETCGACLEAPSQQGPKSQFHDTDLGERLQGAYPTNHSTRAEDNPPWDTREQQQGYQSRRCPQQHTGRALNKQSGTTGTFPKGARQQQQPHQWKVHGKPTASRRAQQRGHRPRRQQRHKAPRRSRHPSGH